MKQNKETLLKNIERYLNESDLNADDLHLEVEIGLTRDTIDYLDSEDSDLSKFDFVNNLFKLLKILNDKYVVNSVNVFTRDEPTMRHYLQNIFDYISKDFWYNYFEQNIQEYFEIMLDSNPRHWFSVLYLSYFTKQERLALFSKLKDNSLNLKDKKNNWNNQSCDLIKLFFEDLIDKVNKEELISIFENARRLEYYESKNKQNEYESELFLAGKSKAMLNELLSYHNNIKIIEENGALKIHFFDNAHVLKNFVIDHLHEKKTKKRLYLFFSFLEKNLDYKFEYYKSEYAIIDDKKRMRMALTFVEIFSTSNLKITKSKKLDLKKQQRKKIFYRRNKTRSLYDALLLNTTNLTQAVDVKYKEKPLHRSSFLKMKKKAERRRNWQFHWNFIKRGQIKQAFTQKRRATTIIRTRLNWAVNPYKIFTEHKEIKLKDFKALMEMLKKEPAFIKNGNVTDDAIELFNLEFKI